MLFELQLSRTLGMTRERLRDEMTLAEFVEQMAYHLYFDPLPNSWQQTSVIASSTLKPHAKRGAKITPFMFVPVRQLADIVNTQAKDELVAAAIVARLKARQKWLQQQELGHE